MHDRLRRFSTWWLVLAALGVILRLPLADAGFHMDDFAQLAMVEGVWPVHRSPLNLFDFAHGDPEDTYRLMSAGALPWWTSPDLKLSAMRPLSSALIYLDITIFGRAPKIHHVHSLLWWLAMFGSAGLLIQRILPTKTAVLALCFLVVDECHTFPIAWLANRNAIVSAAFVFLAVWAHLRWRDDGWKKGGPLSAIALALALAGGEYGLCGLGWIAAAELRPGAGELKQRFKALAPALVVTLGYIAIHRMLGYGAGGSEVYVDPLRQPATFLAAVALRVPTLLADVFIAVPSSKLPLWTRVAVAAPWIGAVATGLVAWCLRRAELARYRWLLFAVGFALVPVASSFVSSRLTLLAAPAGAALLAAIAGWAWTQFRESKRASGAVLAGYIALTHLVVAPYWVAEETWAIFRLNGITHRTAMQFDVDDSKIANQRVVVFNAADPMTLIYPPYLRWSEGRPLPRSWWSLSMARQTHLAHRVGKKEIELEIVDGALLRGPVERLFRRYDDQFEAGDRVELDGLTVTILQVAADGAPTRVSFEFERALEHRSMVFAIMTPNGLIRYPLGRTGSTMTIPPGTLPVYMDF